MIRKYVLILVGLVVLLSCNDDEDSGKNGNLIRFSVGESYFSPEMDAWIMVSDDEGELLDLAQLQNKSTYTFALPPFLKNGDVALTLIYNSYDYVTGGPKTSIVTCTDVHAGDYGVGFVRQTNADFLGEVWLTVQGDFRLEDPQLDWMVPSAMVGVGYDPEKSGLRFQIMPVTQQTGLLVMKREQPLRYLYTEVEVGRQYERTEADFKTGATHVFGVPAGTFTRLTLTGTNRLGDFPYYGPYDSIVAVDGGIEVPTIPEIFDMHTLEFTLDDNRGKVYSTRASFDQFPTSLTVLDGSIENVVLEGDVIHWEPNATRKPDGINFYISKNDYYSEMSWLVVGATDKRRITLPQIPGTVTLSALPAETKERSFTVLAREWGVQATLLDYAEYNDYQDYLLKYHLRKTEYGEPDYWKMTQEWR